MKKKLTSFIHRAAMTLLFGVLTATTAWAETVKVEYLFKLPSGNYETGTANATPLNGDEVELSGGWYVVNSDINFNHGLQLSGSANIILADGYTMTIGSEKSPISQFGIYGSGGSITPEGGSKYDLCLYGQSRQSGGLVIYGPTTGESYACIKVHQLEVHGGNLTLHGYNGITTRGTWNGNVFIEDATVNITTGNNDGKGIDSYCFSMSGGALNISGMAEKAVYSNNFSMYGGTLTVNDDKNANDNGNIISSDNKNGTFDMTGGYLYVNGANKGIYAPTVTLGLKENTDLIYANNYYESTVKIAGGKTLTNNETIPTYYWGTLNETQKNEIKGKTLRLAPFNNSAAGTVNDPYIIYTTNGWNAFCGMINSDTDGLTGKYVKLGADIEVTAMAGTSDKPFKGHFNGDGHTQTFNYTASADDAAPFAYVDGATIENLHVDGTINTAYKFAAGIAAHTKGATNITNCRSSIVVNSSTSGEGIHGGFVGQNETNGTLTITGSLFDGKLLTTNGTTNCGGFVGWSGDNATVNIKNSIYAPTAVEGSEAWILASGSATFARYHTTLNVSNSYYTTDFIDSGTYQEQGKKMHSITAGSHVTITCDGTAAEYNVSGITKYDIDENTINSVLKYNDTYYSGKGKAVQVTLSKTTPTPAGYEELSDYSASAGELYYYNNILLLSMPDQDVTIKRFKLITYDITYNLNKGTNNASNPDSYTVESNEITLAAPTREGYNFAGWYTNDDFNGNPVTTIAAGSTGAVVLWAKWTAIAYTLTYDLAEGTMPAGKSNPTSYTAEDKNIVLNNPTREGYAFVGWNYDRTETIAGNSNTFNSTDVFVDIEPLWQQNLAFTATWVAEDETHKDLAKCKATVYNPTYIGEGNYVGYSYENGNGITVKDGGTLLAYIHYDQEIGNNVGDYRYSNLVSLDGGNCEDVGEHCRLLLVGCGSYVGGLSADVVIVPGTDSGKLGDLTWYVYGDSPRKLFITPTSAGSSVAMTSAGSNTGYDWNAEAYYTYPKGFQSIVIEEGVTSIGSYAFAGHSMVSQVSLPSTLTSIGESAFAGCNALTIDLDNDLPSGVTIESRAFDGLGTIIGSLSNTGDNSNVIDILSTATITQVTLAGRTLYKDGNWNTLCLPFEVKDGDPGDNITFSKTPLEGATVMELDVDGYYDAQNTRYDDAAEGLKRTGLDGSTLNLYFQNVTTIDPGKPYLIKWDSGDDLTETDLKFNNSGKVYTDTYNAESKDGKVTFMGTYSQRSWDSEDKSILFLGGNNTLYYPDGTATTVIGACRAYFQLNTTTAVRAFNLHFGESNDETGVTTPLALRRGAGGEVWYSLDGVKLDKRPTKKGFYIHNGKKVVVP